MKSPKGAAIKDENIDKCRAVSLSSRTHRESYLLRAKNHCVCTGDVCQPGLSLTSSYLADKEKDGEGALSEWSLRDMTQAAAVEGGNHRNQCGG